MKNKTAMSKCPACLHRSPHEDEVVYCEVPGCNCDRSAVENFKSDEHPCHKIQDKAKKLQLKIREALEHSTPIEAIIAVFVKLLREECTGATTDLANELESLKNYD